MSSTSRRTIAVLVNLLLVSSAAADWEQLNSGTIAELYSVHFPEGTQVGYAVGGVNESLGGQSVVVKTTDGGANWVTHNMEFHGGLYSVYFKDNNNGFALGAEGEAIRTTDGAATWDTMAIPDGGVLNSIQFPENGQIGYIGLCPKDFGSRVLKTTDGGDNWATIIISGPLPTSRSCRMATDNIGVVVGDSGFVVATTDGFGTYTAQGPQTIARLSAAAFSPADPNKGYLIENDLTHGVIRYTDDGGATLWDSVTCPTVTVLCGVDMPTNNVAYFCGMDGFIGKTLTPTYIQNTEVPSGVTGTMCGLCFPNGADTGFAVGVQGVILRTYDGGGVQGIADARAPATGRTGIRVVSNPSRHGITFRADADVHVVVFDAAGRVVKKQAANRGLNFLPLSKSGVYVVKVTTKGFSTTQKLVVEH